MSALSLRRLPVQNALKIYRNHGFRYFSCSKRRNVESGDSNILVSLKIPTYKLKHAETGTQTYSPGLANKDASIGPKNTVQETSDYDDAKLRQIIETSNMSAARQLERQRQRQLELQMKEGMKATDLLGKSPGKTDRKPDTASIPNDPINIKPTQDKTKIDVEGKNTINVAAVENANTDRIKDPRSSSDLSNEAQTRKPSNTDSFLKHFTEKVQATKSDVVSWAHARWSATQDSFNNVGRSLNDATGYSEIEKHKLLVEHVEKEIEQARDAVKGAKLSYEQAIQKRSDLQKEINELLTRKHTWSPEDVERFTELYKNDHQNQHKEASCKQALEEAEQHVEAVQIKLTALILTRYHEEQLWSDKIRQALTWGTWMLMGVNLALFATATFFVEPWKRRKLVNAFHEEVQLKLDEYSSQLQSLSRRLPLEGGLGAIGTLGAIQGAGKVAEHAGETAPAHRISFFGLNSWTSFRTWVRGLVTAVKSPGNLNFYMGKPDFALLSGLLVAFGWLFGLLLNRVMFSR